MSTIYGYIETKWGRRQAMIGARTLVKSLGAVNRPKERVVEVQGDHVIHCLENVKDIREGYHMEPIAPNIYVQPLEVQYGSPGPTFHWSKKVVWVKTPKTEPTQPQL